MQKIYWWVATLSWACLIFYLTTIPDFHPSSDTLISWVLSNGGHFCFFGVQAVLLSLTLPHRPLTINHWPLTITSFYGLLIELVQRGIPGRSFGLGDWALDTLGAVAFLFILKKLQSKL